MKPVHSWLVSAASVAFLTAGDGARCQEATPTLTTLERELTAEATPPQRRSAIAKQLARGGAAGVEVIARVLRALDESPGSSRGLQLTCLSALSKARSGAAWDALAEVALNGSERAQQTAYLKLEDAPRRESVIRAFTAGAGSREFEFACRSVKWLAEHGHRDVKTRVAKLADLVRNAKPPIVNSYALLHLRQAIAALLESELYAAYLCVGARVVDTRADRVAGAEKQKERARVLADPGFVDWLIDRGLKRKTVVELRYALQVLRTCKDDRIAGRAAALLGEHGESVDLAALALLRGRRDPAIEPALRKLLKTRAGEARIEALRALDALHGAARKWIDELISSLEDRDEALANAAMDLLADKDARAALPAAYALLADKAWTRRLAAYRFLQRVRSVDAVPKLIARVGKEQRLRLRELLLDTLYVHTGQRFPDAVQWQRWWRENAKSFQLIPAVHVEAIAAARDARGKGSKRTVATFYGIPLDSNRVIFAIDVSDSMSAVLSSSAAGADPSTPLSKLDEAKRQLKDVLGGMDKSYRFNVIEFESIVRPMFRKMRPATRGTRAKATAGVDKMRPRDGTDLFGGLERAFASADVDTIYLLTDGDPSEGRITDPIAIGDQVLAWSRARAVRIHCVALGYDSKLLKRLAGETGGSYTCIE